MLSEQDVKKNYLLALCLIRYLKLKVSFVSSCAKKYNCVSKYLLTNLSSI